MPLSVTSKLKIIYISIWQFWHVQNTNNIWNLVKIVQLFKKKNTHKFETQAHSGFGPSAVRPVFGTLFAGTTSSAVRTRSETNARRIELKLNCDTEWNSAAYAANRATQHRPTATPACLKLADSCMNPRAVEQISSAVGVLVSFSLLHLPGGAVTVAHERRLGRYTVWKVDELPCRRLVRSDRCGDTRTDAAPIHPNADTLTVR